MRRHVIVLVAGALALGCAVWIFSAIQRAREAAARMACASNFAGLGSSLHSYAGANQDKLPAGTVPHPDLPPEQRLSLVVSLLPYIEQKSVYDRFDLTRGAGDPRNEAPARTHIRHLMCPSGNGPAAPLTHYVGVAGVGPDAATLPLGHPRAGVFGYDRNTKLTEKGFPDGTCNTLLLIETGQPPGHWAYGGTATLRAFDREAAPYIGPERPFGGFHNGQGWFFTTPTHGCNVALADGSYRTLTNKMDPALLEALATVAGREALPANW